MLRQLKDWLLMDVLLTLMLLYSLVQIVEGARIITPEEAVHFGCRNIGTN
jgi:hypothetical protein